MSDNFIDDHEFRVVEKVFGNGERWFFPEIKVKYGKCKSWQSLNWYASRIATNSYSTLEAAQFKILGYKELLKKTEVVEEIIHNFE
jgi:hypothetical protein